jgi:transcription antitermination factor NusG
MENKIKEKLMKNNSVKDVLIPVIVDNGKQKNLFAGYLFVCCTKMDASIHSFILSINGVLDFVSPEIMPEAMTEEEINAILKYSEKKAADALQ